VAGMGARQLLSKKESYVYKERATNNGPLFALTRGFDLIDARY